MEPPQAIYNAIWNLNISFFDLAREVTSDNSIKYITTYHDEYSLREQFPDCYFGITSHRAFVSICLGFNPELRTVPATIDWDDSDYIYPDWNEIANIAPEIDIDELHNIAVFKEKK